MPVDQLGTNLRIVRERLGLTLREVALRSGQLAEASVFSQGRISASWLRRVEQDPRRELSAVRLIVLLKVYGLTLEELLTVDSKNGEKEGRRELLTFDANHTGLIPLGPLETNARLLLPDDSHKIGAPLNTEIMRSGRPQRPGRFIRAVVGKVQNYLHPIVPAGSVVLVDTHRRSLNVRQEEDIEMRRPMFLLELHEGCICCWCELLGKDHSRIVVLPHPCAGINAMELRLDRDVTVRGRIVAIRIVTLVEKVA
jgi:transcriptional regulator with XRE-family HTH domain